MSKTNTKKVSKRTTKQRAISVVCIVMIMLMLVGTFASAFV